MPIESGLCARLVTKESEGARQQRIYHCRHCMASQFATTKGARERQACTPLDQRQPDSGGLAPTDSAVDDASHAAETTVTKGNTSLRPAAGNPGRQRKQAKAFTFDGLRSHAKEK